MTTQPAAASRRCPHCQKPDGHTLMGQPLRTTEGRWQFAGSPRFVVGGRPACPGMFASIAKAKLANAAAPS